MTAAQPPGARRAPIDRADGLSLLYGMLRIRRFEERCAELYTEEKIRGFLHLYIGQEAVAVGVTGVLRPDDPVFGTYREHGHALARGMSARGVMAEMFGRIDGCSRGRGGSMHLFDTERSFYGGNAIVGGHLPMAVGMALGDRMAGRDRVTTAFFGEGAVAEGTFHESMNLASLWACPVLFCCENNLYAMGTPFGISQSQPSLPIKAAGYRIPGETVDGMDVLAVRQAASRAVEHVRSGWGPYLLELQTYRFRAHSMFDPQLYRHKSEVEAWKERDPIASFAQRMRGWGLLEEHDLQDLEEEVGAEVEDAVAFADASALEPVSELTRFVYAEGR